MAEIEELDLDLDLEPEGGKAKGGGWLKITMIALIAVLVLGGGGAALWYFVLAEGGDADAEGAFVAPDPPTYLTLEPALIGNIEGPDRIRYVQVGLDMAFRDEKMLQAARTHMPVIRNNLIMLLSGKTHADLKTPEGKEATRQEMLESIREVLQTRAGAPGVESIYFTSFVMQ